MPNTIRIFLDERLWAEFPDREKAKRRVRLILREGRHRIPATRIRVWDERNNLYTGSTLHRFVS